MTNVLNKINEEVKEYCYLCDCDGEYFTVQKLNEFIKENNDTISKGKDYYGFSRDLNSLIDPYTEDGVYITSVANNTLCGSYDYIVFNDNGDIIATEEYSF